MGFSFDDQVDEEDMDLDEEEDSDDNDLLNIDCESSDMKINVLEALVKVMVILCTVRRPRHSHTWLLKLF